MIILTHPDNFQKVLESDIRERSVSHLTDPTFGVVSINPRVKTSYSMDKFTGKCKFVLNEPYKSDPFVEYYDEDSQNEPESWLEYCGIVTREKQLLIQIVDYGYNVLEEQWV